MSGAFVLVDRSQFPDNVRKELLDSLSKRSLNHKFHYESYKQATKWLSLHEAYSPSRTDSSCARMYEDAFRALAAMDLAEHVEVVSLGCGGGQKEIQLLKALQKEVQTVSCVMSDVSLPLVLAAQSDALQIIPTEHCRAIVCDLATAQNLPAIFENQQGRQSIVTAFGIIPNFEPCTLLDRISSLFRSNDLMLLSANLAPGQDYDAGVRSVLPQYDNPLTRDWLITFLLDVGFEIEDGEIVFGIQTDELALQRITAHFHLSRDRRIRVLGENFSFRRGESIQIFFSYRHTVSGLKSLFRQHGIQSLRHWTNLAGDEAVFLCRREQSSEQEIS
jgi:L-histidine Nalpha-methyltransferase